MLQLLQKTFKKLLSFASMIIALQFNSGVAFGQTTLAEWATSGSHTPTTYSTGNGAWQLVNSQASYNSSATCGGPFYGTNWSSGAYWQCDVNTTGYGTITISTVQVRSSGTGPANFQIQYNNNTGSGWVNLSGGTYAIASTSCVGIGPFTLPAACNNAADVSIRFTVTNSTSESGGTIGSGGTSYFGELTLTGVASSFPSVAITSTSPATGNIIQGTTNNVLQTYNLAVTSAAATLSGLTITTAGTYASADITNLKCWYSSSPSFSVGSSTLLSTLTTPGVAGSKVFPSFISQNISSGTTGYIFITADVAAGATVTHTINLGTTAFSNFGLASATETGTNPVAASNAQTIIAASNCSGTPNAGIGSPSPAALCGSGTSLVSLTGGTAASGIIYQWSSNTSNIPPGTNISGATGASYTTPTISSTIYYWCTTTCTISGLSATSSVGVVSVNPVPSVAAISGATSLLLGATTTLSDVTTGVTTGWISSNNSAATIGSSTGIVTSVAVGTTTISYSVINSSGCSAIATQTVTVTYPYCAPTVSTGEGLSFSTTGGTVNITGYPESTGVVNKVTSYGVTASPGATINYTIHNYDTYPGFTSIWLDWNQDHTFGDSTSELELSSQAIAASSTYSGSFIVPTTAEGGTTVMRLSYGESGTIYTSPCGSATYGGSIDFYFNVIPGITTNPSNISVSESAAASFSTTVLAAISYQWQRGISGTYTNVDNTTDGGVYSGYNTAMLNISSAALAMNGYTYRLVATNAAGSATSTAATLTVNVVPPCSGMPAAGTVSVSSPNLCVSGSTTMSLTGGATGTGLTYQWSSSASNTPPGTNISGATSALYVTPTLTSTTYYWCTTTCSASTLSNISSVGIVNVNSIPVVAAITGVTSLELGLTTTTLSDVTTDVNTAWSSSDGTVATVGSSTGIVTGVSTGTATITYSVTNSGGCTGIATQSVTVTYPYCIPSVTNSEGLSFSTIGGATNITGYSETTGVVNKVGSYGISASPGTTVNYTVTNYTSGYPGDGAIWVDWNQDGVFADSTGEQELVSQSMSEGGNYNGSFTVPTTARSGETVMRVSWGETTATIYSSPCGNAGYGAAIDFYVKVIPGITTNPVGISVNEGSDASFSGVALATTSYQWQRSTGSGYSNINSSTDGGVYAGYNTATLLISNATLAMSGYTYQLVATNSVGNATSTVATLTVTPVPPCTGTPNSGTVSVSLPSLCGSGISILTLNGGSTGTGLTYQWSSSAANTPPGTNINGATNSIYTPSSISATTYYWCTTTCSTTSLLNISTDGTVTVNTIPTVTVTPAGGSYCSGTSGLSMTASGATSYVWSPALGLSATTGSTVVGSYSINPVTYTVTGTSSAGCSASNTATVTYYSTPLTPVVTPASLNACLGSSVNTMSAGVGVAGPFTYTTSATTGTANGSNSTLSSTISASTIPTGVTVNSVSVTLNCSANSSYLSDYVFNLVAPNGKILNLVNSVHGTGSFTNLVLSSSGSTPIGSPYTGTYEADAATGVGPSADLSNVTSWSSLYSSPSGTWTLLVYNTSTYTSNAFALTNWSLNIGYSLPSVTWSPSTYLFTNSGGTLPYAGIPAYSVYENPNTVSTTIYSVTATNGGCTSTTTVPVTVNGLPMTTASNSGVACVGGSVTLNANASGAISYLWQGPGAYTSTLASPILGITSTTLSGTYSVTVISAAGCIATSMTIVTVNATPTAVAGNSGYICNGGTAILNETVSGGSVVNYAWAGSSILTGSSSTTATADPATVGTAIYTLTVNDGTGNSGCSSQSTTTVTINATPTAIAGNNGYICNGGTVTLDVTGTTGSVANYAWTGNSVIGTGLFATVTADPTSTSTYTLTVSDGSDNSGCSSQSTTLVTVNTTPTAIAGNNGYICNGGTVTLDVTGTTGSVASYAWMGNSVIGTGLFAIVTADPTSTSTYTLTVSDGSDNSGCSSQSTTVVTVNVVPSATAGNTGYICNGGTVTLNESGIVGSVVTYIWSGVDFIGSTTTATTVVDPPTGNTTYTLTVNDGSGNSGCSSQSTTVVTVNVTPSATAGNTGYICYGGTVTLNETGIVGSVVDYTWNGVNILIGSTSPTATADPTTLGTTTYTLTVDDGSGNSGCSSQSTTTVTVDSIAVSPTNSSYACYGGTVNLYSGESGTAPSVTYAWSGPLGFTATTSGASVNNVSTANAGVYTVTAISSASGCVATSTTNVLIDTIAVAPYNSGHACNGGTVALYSVETGTAPSVTYSWSGPGSYASASVNPVLNNTATSRTGTYTITASSAGSGCIVSGTTSVTVDTFNVLVSNTSPACVGTEVDVNSVFIGTVTPTTYSWSGPMSFTSMAADAVVTDSALLGMAGVYTLNISASGSGCSVTKTTTVTVNPIPVPIVGDLNLCVGLTQALTDYSGGGTWSSNATGTVTISSAGVATGVSPGTATIYYTFGTGCNVFVIATVDPSPTAIGGTKTVCIGSVTSLNDTAIGGSWISSNSNATVDGSGDVAGVSAGTVTITYIFPGGCYRTTTVTVNPLPNIILGSNTVCAGSSTLLSDATAGGSWSSLNTLVATVGTLSYPVTVTGVSAGTATLVYTLAATGCTRSFDMTVNAITPVLGNSPVCAGSTITLSDATGAGTWSSSSGTVATVDGSGDVTGVAQGTSKITYTSPAGCTAVATVSVEAMSAILGNTVLCQNTTTALSDNASGGAWTSSNSAVASVGSTGIVAGGSISGSATITYAIGSTGCSSSVTVMVNPITPILGAPGTVCAGSTITLSDATEGGVWSSSNSTLASVDVSGDVTGMASGTVTITYLESATGCKATGVVTIAPISAIHGSTTMCSASTITLSDATTGGSWSSSNTSAATIGSTGSPVTVTGVSGGSTTISYMTAAGCSSSILLNVNQSPAIGGTNTVCIGLTTTLTDNISGGTWSSSNTAKATVDGSGDVTGIASGTSVISYLSTTGCSTSMTVTVNANPSAILGGSQVCVDNVLSLSDATAGGSWSTTPGVSLTGTGGSVTGVTTGTAGITYTLGTGCVATDVITVSAPPTAISGSSSVCAGGTLSFTDGVSGGTWSSSNTAIATIGSASGLLSAIQGGTTNITYATGSGCTATMTVTVSPIMAITGGTNVCTGYTLALGDASSGGTWTTSSSAISIVGSTGLVTGLSVDTATVVYTIPSGCSRTTLISVNASPTAIAGVLSLCAGTTSTLSDDGGGSWSMASLVATVVGSTGVVTASTGYAGTGTVSYTAGAGCTVTAIVTVSPNPTPIQGPTTECAGATVTLSDATLGGTWIGTAGITVTGSGSTATLVAGGTGGTATVSYSLPTGCSVTVINTIKPSPAPIQGATTVCVGGVTLLSDATSGVLSWSSSNSSIARAAGGDITGESAGSATITYTLTSGCLTTTTVTVINASAITGNTIPVCPNTTLSLTDGAITGTWSSSNNTVATVGTDGTVSALTSGTATITFVATGVSGCSATTVVTVSALPVAITGAGTGNLCSNATLSLNDATAGGTWTSSNTLVATVGTGGLVSGVSAGPVVISYTGTSGCSVISNINVNTAPGAILGTTGVCVGSTTSLSDNVSGGTWTSSITSHATIGASSGIVSGVVNGTTNITYTTNGCYATATVSVNVQPGSIFGATAVCSGTTTQLSNLTSGGSWSAAGTGSISSGGLFTAGATAGTTTVEYATASGCSVSETVTTNLAPGAVNGPSGVCAGATITLSDAVSGGNWSASSVLVAVDGSGDVTADSGASGTVTITYTMAGGCYATETITVTNLPSAILGSATLCAGSTVTLSNTSSGGVWSSGATSVATVGSGSGSVTGVAAGTGTITYTVGSGCATSEIVTVYAVPELIGGNGLLCEGGTLQLTDTGSGTWSLVSSPAASVNSSTGLVTASTLHTGTATVTYTAAYTGCIATVVVTVNTTPTAIQGLSSECSGASVTLSDATAGGTWSVSGDATISGGGVLLAGATGGTALVTYALSGGCSTTSTNTIYAAPAPISGTTTVCVGGTTVLTDATTGTASWSSSNTAFATVAGGDVTGVAPGSATITYTLSTGGCITTTTVTIVAAASITGNTAPICTGTGVLLTAGTGTWSSSATTIATVGTGGMVNGVSNGTATITFVSGAGCMSTTIVTVNTATPISGSGSLCTGTTAMFSDATAGGTWTASGDLTAIGSSGAITAGGSAGSGSVTYTLGSGCFVTIPVTVIAGPTPILGTTTVCVGGTTVLTDATTGTASWSSSNTAFATVAGGDVTGVAPGSATITYTLSTGGCITTTTVTITPAPGIAGNSGAICPGSTLSLSSGTGTWSSSNTAIASVGTGGTVTGVSGGTTTITFIPTGTGGCIATTIVTVNSAPAISGSSSVCSTGTTTLSDGVPGGTWISGNTGYATVGSTNGIVSGVAIGSAVITYTTPLSCQVTTTLAVTSGTSPIGGSGSVCVGSAITLTDATGGGSWSSSNTTLGTVDASGDVTGISSGVITITFTSGGCSATKGVSVNALPSVINGPSTICVGTPTSLTDASTGGLWSVSGGTASIVGSTGIITGTSAGTATVSYNLNSTGCGVAKSITVISTAGTISGNSAICAGSNITLSDVGGGTWTSSNTAVVTVGSASGTVNGIGSGTATITYSLGGCYVTAIATVNGAVGVIKGATSVCQGATISLSDATTGGTWSSSSTAIATLGASTGSPVIVSAVNTGSPSITTVNIGYASAAGCTTSVTVTVNPLPGSINGNLALCPSSTSLLTDAISGGVWSMASSDASVVGSTGVVTSSSGNAGTATISYTIGSCSVTGIVTVNPNPGAIQGATYECAGLTTALTDATAGGTWTGGGDATVSGTGTSGTLVAGATSGSATVTYTLPTGCKATSSNTIYASPQPIQGNFNLCVGLVNILSDASAVSSWSSSNTTIAKAAGGDITGVAPGTATITFKTSATGSCTITQVVTVSAMPVVTAINGPATISNGSPVSISDATLGGIWTSSNTSVIVLGGSTGNPISATAETTTGSSVISYAVTISGCTTTVTKTFSAASAAHPGSGTATVYAGSVVSINDDVASGAWSSSDNGIATVDENGLVTGIAPGIASITHTVTGDDGVTATGVTNVVVSAVPATISLSPNPNKGTFVVRGTTGSVSDEEVTLEVTDVLGQVIYKNKVTAQGGKLNETITLSSVLANGMYILNVQSGTENKTLHFVIEQ